MGVNGRYIAVTVCRYYINTKHSYSFYHCYIHSTISAPKPENKKNKKSGFLFESTMFEARFVTWLFFLLILMLGALNAHIGYVIGCHDAEREALLKFKQSLNDTQSQLSSWVGKDCCLWEGVGCDNVTSYVDHLDVHGPYVDPDDVENPWTIIAPEVDRSLVELSHLNYLDLSFIDFQGSEIPGFVGSFKHLRYLNLSYSNFGGVVPSQLSDLTRLHTFDLVMSGQLSSDLHWVSGLVNLQYLNIGGVFITRSTNSTQKLNMPPLLGLQLSTCQLTVPIFLSLFSNITQLSTIQQIDLSSNNFQVSFPDFVANMTSLRYLDLSNNQFNGSIPLWLGNVSKLEHLDLSNNMFNGPIPRVFANMTSLTYLDFSHNQFNRSIPLWLGNIRNLEHLDLSNNMLDGPLPHVLANLTSLTYLDFSVNTFSGSVPLWLSNMRTLEHLDLSENLLEGPLHHVFTNTTSLTYLDLSVNRFNGSIPLWIRNMRKLQNLDLSGNKFSQVEGGVIMGILGNLCSLKSFDLSDNQIVGEIGAHHNLSKCVTYDLEHLVLGSNMIGGTLPSWLGDFKRLTLLDVSYNSLQGHIPVSIGRLSNLVVLGLCNNNLTGTIPESLGQCKALYAIDLSSNNLQGVLSESLLADLSSLQCLCLSSNSLENKLSSNWLPPFQLTQLYLKSCRMQTQFPQWIGKQTNLQFVDLSDNMISGKLDPLLLLENLDQLNISHNQLTGRVPYFTSSALSSVDLSYNLLSGSLVHENDTVGSPVCQLPSLSFLDLQRNNISGTIRDCWGNSTYQVYINLSSNNLSGIIPVSIGQPGSLEFLKLSNNSLQGPIPPTLITSYLQILDLGDNKLSGKIPTIEGAETGPLLKVLRLRGNQLEGDIPTALCSLPSLQFIDLANNNLTGGVPRCFGNLMGMESSLSRERSYNLNLSSGYEDPVDDSTAVVLKGAVLQYAKTLEYVVNLDLSCNALVGSIPDEITNLSGLVGLNLSHNQLTGMIPKKIGQMTFLESLDLSNNQLSGTIPASIADLTSLSSINVSNNNLHGEIPTGKQLQALPYPSAYDGNPGLCGDPLPNKCAISQSRNQPQQEHEEDDDKDDDFMKNPLFYFVIISGFATGFWGVVGSLLLKDRFRFRIFQLVGNVADYLYQLVLVRVNRFRN